MKINVTPEEKLLALIRNKKRQNEPNNPPQETRKDYAPFLVLKRRFFRDRPFEPSLLKDINKYLIILLGVLVLYFMAEIMFIKPHKNISSIVPKESRGFVDKTPQAKVPPIVKDYSDYLKDISDRHIFGQLSGGESSSPQDINVSDNISDKVGLVGIVAGDNPQAAIEDKKNQKTYYLNKGQSFEGYVVDEISEDKVILDYEGKKITLFL